jgi:drug/metabolite transporter (DMT)-like permease
MSLAGPLFMLVSACFFTGMNVLLKLAMTEFRVWDIGFYRLFGGLVLYFCLVGFVVTAPFFLQAPVLPLSISQTLVCAGIIMTSILGQLLMNRGFGCCRSWEGGLYMTSELLFTATAGIIMFGDPGGWHFFGGGILVLVSAVAIQLEQALRGGNLPDHLQERPGGRIQ